MEEFDKELNEIKNKINEIQLSNEFKNRLQQKMDEEFYNQQEKHEDNKSNIFKFNSISRRLATIAACFIFLISGCITFADEIEYWVAKVFSNTNKQVELAVENGDYREIDMNYVENNGVAIKVDYLINQDDILGIAFNVKTEEEYDNIFFEYIVIKGANNNILFKSNNFDDEKMVQSKYTLKKINNNEYIIICDILKKDFTQEYINVDIKNIYGDKEGNLKLLSEKSNLQVNL